MKIPNYWKTKQMRFELDTDKDGVKDYKDCRPFNPRKQHISNTQKKRVDDTDTLVTVEHGSNKGKLVHISDAKKLAPQGRGQMYSLFSKYPNLLGTVERMQGKGKYRTMGIEYTSDDTGKTLYLEGIAGQHSPEGIRVRNLGFQGRREFDIPKHVPKAEEDKYTRHEMAETLFHEIKHEDQERKDPKFKKKYDSIVRKNKIDPNDPNYYMNPYEKSAKDYGERKAQEVYNNPSLEEHTSLQKRFFNIIKEEGDY